MKRQIVQIEIWKRDRRSFKRINTFGYESGIPGIAITLNVNDNNLKTFSVTHIASGMTVYSGEYKTIKAARRDCKLLSGVKWDRDMADILKDKKAATAAKLALESSIMNRIIIKLSGQGVTE